METKEAMQFKIDAPEFSEQRYDVYKYLRENDPVHWYEDMDTWLIMKHDDVMELSKSEKMVTDILVRAKMENDTSGDENVKTIVNNISQWMIYNENPYHARIRTYMNRVFKKEHIDKVIPEIKSIVDMYFDQYKGLEKLDFSATLAHRIPAQILAKMIGLDEIDLETFLKWSDSIALFMQDFVVSPVANKEIAKETALDMEDMKAAFVKAIDRRIEEPQNDLLTDLALGIEEYDISRDELVLQLIHLIFGGHKIPQFVMCNLLHCLFNNPEIIENIKNNDISYLRKVIDEVMRFESPIQYITRHASCDFELRGKQIKKGDSVFLMLGSANRDEDVFDAPDEFNPSRTKGKHTSFGGGIHVCIGAALVNAEIREIFRNLFESDVDIESDYDLSEPKWTQNATFHGLLEMNIRFKEKEAVFNSTTESEKGIEECPYHN